MKLQNQREQLIGVEEDLKVVQISLKRSMNVLKVMLRKAATDKFVSCKYCGSLSYCLLEGTC